jgi:hypothetical protein
MGKHVFVGLLDFQPASDDPGSPIQASFGSAQFCQRDLYQSIIRVGIAVTHPEIAGVGSPWVSQNQTG